jgi:transposase
MVSGTERIDHGKRFANGKVYINGIEGFLELCEGEAFEVPWC